MTPEAQHPAPATSPIADLSYRHYEGPLHTRALRWWIVALAGIRMARKTKGFWVVSALALLPFIGFGLLLYFFGGPSGQTPNTIPLMGSTPGMKYAVVFYQAFENQQLWLFLITLMIGAGSIAADNQANALLLYLSKPITKSDYLLGKWMGIFLIVFAVAVLPALALYLFCLLSFASSGFLREEPLLFFRLIAASMIPAAVHASLMVGFSAWSKTGRMAGALYAGLYFVSMIVAVVVWAIRAHGKVDTGILERHLSVPGAITGLAQNVYGVVMNIPDFDQAQGVMRTAALHAPPLWAMLLLTAGLIVLGVAAARSKIRAVEVVRG